MSKTKSVFATASRGFGWSFMASVLVLFVSLVAQYILGRLLSKHDFGVYAIAISFSNMFIVFRDGGVARWLARLSREEFDLHTGSSMYLAYASSFAVAAIVAAASFVVGEIYQQPQTTQVMLVLALAFPLTAYPIVARARLQVELRFREMAWIKFGAGILRYGLTVLFALGDMGPLSFAWPVVFASLFELVAFVWLTRIPLLVPGANLSSGWQLLRESRWSLVGSFFGAMVRQCDYAVLGLLVPTEVVGVYFFAYQLAMQPIVLFGGSLRRVVLPVFSRFAGDRQRESRGIRYAGTFIGMVAVPLLLMLSVTAAPLTELLWRGKWSAAVFPLQVLVMVMPMNLLSIFVESVAQSRGKFRLWTAALCLRGVGFGLAAVVAAWAANWQDVAVISVVMAIYLALSSALEVHVLLRILGLSFASLIETLILPLGCSVALAAAVAWTMQNSYVSSPALGLAVLGGTFALSVLVVFNIFCRPALTELRSMLRRSAWD